jgi:ectoine hydroxylase-related dioxygenase (phytanoyl-CoA dioxygenase family)
VSVTERADRYTVSIDEFSTYQRDGFVVVRDLVAQSEVDELREHTEALMAGELPEQRAVAPVHRSEAEAGAVQLLEPPPAGLSDDERAQWFLRLHMLHRRLELHERYLLHPRVLDVLEALIGPDVTALQSMLFVKPPGKPGQGWHQDSFYIPTHPDTLIGAWIAIDACDELNGAMWFAKGSQVEPIYPPPLDTYGFSDQTMLSGLDCVRGVSDPDDGRNALTRVADRYDQVLASAQPGDVVFFNGHILHRSKANYTTDRYRRSFVGHYMNARSFTQWGRIIEPGEDTMAADVIDEATGGTNGSHILARGDTHLPFALPRFGTACAALEPPEERRRRSEYAQRILARADSMLGCAAATPAIDDDE